MRKPLPCALKFSAKPAFGHVLRAPVLEPQHPVPDLCLPPPDVDFASVYLLFLLVSVVLNSVLKLPTLRLHQPGRTLCLHHLVCVASRDFSTTRRPLSLATEGCSVLLQLGGGAREKGRFPPLQPEGGAGGDDCVAQRGVLTLLQTQ